MAVLADNLTTVTVVDSDLLARIPSLDQRYLPPGAADFSPQIATGLEDALVRFESMTGRDPVWCLAVRAEAWKAIVVLSTLLVLLRASTDERSMQLAAGYETELATRFKLFRYQWDADQSGSIDDLVDAGGADEGGARAGEIELWR